MVSLWALRNNQTVDTVSMVDKIRDKIILVLHQLCPLSYALQERVAVHECGHLLMGYFSTLHESPSKLQLKVVVIVPWDIPILFQIVKVYTPRHIYEKKS